MKFAVLILAANFPEGVAALASYFKNEPFQVFVHVDMKMEISPFVKALEGNKNGNLIFISQRQKVFWRGFSMVEATVSLIKTAKEIYPFDRYLLISDDSAPLLPRSELIKRISEQSEYIDARVSEQFRYRYNPFFMFDSGATSVRWVPLKQREFTTDTIEKIDRLKNIQMRGKKGIEHLYHGSQWWCVSSKAIDLFLESWSDDIWLRESFEFSEVPDEHYIQTVICEIINPPPRRFMFTDWSGEVKPKIYSDPTQIYGLSETDALFVRKVHWSREVLESYILSLDHDR